MRYQLTPIFCPAEALRIAHAGRITASLRDAGFDAKYMKGGHAAWRAIGGPAKMNI